MGSGFGFPGLPMSSPVIAAAGAAGIGWELGRFVDLSDLGAVTTRSIGREAHAGLPGPRVVEAPSGVLNALGMPGPGIEEFMAVHLPKLAGTGATVVVSLAADTVADFGRLAGALRGHPDVAAVEVNLSSPVLDAGVLPFATDPSGSAAVVHIVRRNLRPGVPLLAKLSGAVADVVGVARACMDAGADALALINAVPGMLIDTESGRAALGTEAAGLTGPAIRPVALRAIWDVHAAMPTAPIVASGGVNDGPSALAMVLAGARVVSLGTSLIRDPWAGHRVQRELAELVAQRRVPWTDLIGAAHRRGAAGPGGDPGQPGRSGGAPDRHSHDRPGTFDPPPTGRRFRGAR